MLFPLGSSFRQDLSSFRVMNGQKLPNGLQVCEKHQNLQTILVF
jgi:hypothetical protein